MKNKDFTTSFSVNQSPAEAFNAIKNVRGWWSGLYEEEFEGNTNKLNDEFTFRAGKGAHYSKQKLVELIPDKKVVWLVTDSELTFLKDTKEWTGTRICFEITDREGKTEVRFTHQDLAPDIECYGACSTAWGKYIHGSLKNLIEKTAGI